MATKKISELTELTSPVGTEELIVNDSGTSKKITHANLGVLPSSVSQIEAGYLDGVTSSIQTQLGTKLPLAGGTMTGAITTNSTFDGRDVATDGSKLDNIEASADVTDVTNVTAAGALMDSELASIAAVKATTGTFLTADQTKLDGIEASADVTDTTNVTASGALMDSEVTNLAQVKAFDTTDYATSTQGTTADDALPKAGGTMTGAITTNSTFDGRDVSTDGAKLDGIAASANNYTHPANHAISVITGLQTALDAKVDDYQVLTDVPSGAVFTDTETTTTLSIATNILSYVDELGATTNLDLSLYLDDTNLAYIASGALNGSTGVATFTRSDASTFTVDLSALLDDTSVTVNNTLTSTSTTAALSANRGKVLKGLVDGLETRVALNDAKVSNVAHPLVETAVPTGAVFTDTDTVYTHPTGAGNLHVPTGGTVDQLLTNTASGTGTWQDAPVSLPSQATHAGKYLTTDSTTASWATLDAVANTTTKGLYEHANTISANYTIATGNNALTAGPITINTGVSVTVPTGSTWVVA
jgi:hypothetical protein